MTNHKYRFFISYMYLNFEDPNITHAEGSIETDIKEISISDLEEWRREVTKEYNYKKVTIKSIFRLRNK